MNKLSKIFQPVVSTPIEAIGKNLEISSRSQKLMIEVGLIRPADNGFFTILPLAYRSIEKCIRIVDHFMKSIGAQKMSIPQLTSIDLWEKSGRYETSKSELFTTTGRQSKKHILGPTYEEAITSMMVDIGLPSYRQFPLKLYQVGNKFRDESRCKFGLLRAKEFLMKDSYSFDIDQSSAMRTYEEYVQAYTDLFHTIEVPTIKVQANVGNIGGSLSHEFQIPCQIGEDALMQCTACNWSANFEMIGDVSTCPQCQSPIERCKSIEVAHTFLLGDKYTKPFQAKFLQSNGKPETLFMGCYGIGISRLVAASIEKLSTEQDIRWPFVLAPYTVCIIPPKRGSKEIASVAHLTDLVYGELTKIQELSDDVVVDDRDGSTIGKRMIDAKRLGYPLIVVIGKDAAGVDGKYELHFTNTGTTKHLSFNELLCEIRDEVNSHRYR